VADTLAYGYITLWGTACAIAAGLVVRSPHAFSFLHTNYRRFLSQAWKVVTFVLAAAGMTIIAPYTGDPTWDYYDALFMSFLTFASAPWAIGTIYQACARALPLRQAYVALCLWLFSASWSYDLYLLFRDGQYPATWHENLVASSVLYVSAGLLWNLDWRSGRGATFGFLEEDWPQPLSDATFSKIAWYALPLIILVGLLILSFL